MVMAITTLMMMLALSVFPLFIPAAITLLHFVVSRRQHGR